MHTGLQLSIALLSYVLDEADESRVPCEISQVRHTSRGSVVGI